MGERGAKVAHVEHTAAGRALHEVLRFRGIDGFAGDRILQPAEDLAPGGSAMRELYPAS